MVRCCILLSSNSPYRPSYSFPFPILWNLLLFVHTHTRAAIDDLPTKSSSIDVAMLIFTLSAVSPSRFACALKKLRGALKEGGGGLLCFRDYGVFDMTMLRFRQSQYRAGGCPAGNEGEGKSESEGGSSGFYTFERGDGTLSTFFELTATERLFKEAGFSIREAKYALVENANRKTGARMKRCFVHIICST